MIKTLLEDHERVLEERKQRQQDYRPELITPTEIINSYQQPNHPHEDCASEWSDWGNWSQWRNWPHQR